MPTRRSRRGSRGWAGASMARRPGAAWTAPTRLTGRPIAPAGSRLRTRSGRSAVVSRTSRRRRSAAANCCSRRCAIVWAGNGRPGVPMMRRAPRWPSVSTAGWRRLRLEGWARRAPICPTGRRLQKSRRGLRSMSRSIPTGCSSPACGASPSSSGGRRTRPRSSLRPESATSQRNSPMPTFGGSTPAWLLWLRRRYREDHDARGAAAGPATSLGVLTATRSGSPVAMVRRRRAQRRSRAMSRSRATRRRVG